MTDNVSSVLFSDDQFDNKKTKQNNGPVTVLGKIFENDEERRQYFREELRKKLPELKQVEGFPIGTDDDIINLSDPPYYTACPNPWLTDFISEWEEEKKQLEKEGKRIADFQVKEPYAADVSEGKNNPIYMAHAYHTKVPHPAIMRYILHYTQPGDIVFDGFAGTGMTGVAANLCGSKTDVDVLKEKDAIVGVRHGICSDLSPIASLIAAGYNLQFDPIEFERKANSILEQVENELGWMYETEVNGKKAKINYTIWSDVFVCPNCRNEIVLWDEVVDLDKEQIKEKFHCSHCGSECSKKIMEKAWETSYDSLLRETVSMNKKVPVRVNYICNGKRGEKSIESLDLQVLEKIHKLNCENYIGTIPEGDESGRNFSSGLRHTHQLFTYRNYIYLNRLFQYIKNDSIYIAWVTSVIQNASKMYKFRLDRKGGIVSGTLFIPSLNIEQNPNKLLKGKIRDFIATRYEQRGNSVVAIMSATKLTSILDNSFDYMFIDPPFGGNFMYSELNSIWEGWIKIKTNIREEAIINNMQKKTIFEYQQLMHYSFKEFYRVLKPGKWITIEFSNTAASVWNSIQNALQGVGFIIANVSAIDKKQGSFKAVTTTTAVKQDLVITCFKPSDSLAKKFSSLTYSLVNVWDFVEEFLRHLPLHVERNNKTTSVIERNPKIIFDRLIAFYVQRNLPIPLDAREFQQGLRDRFIERDGMFFTATQVSEYDMKRKETPEFQELSLFVSSEQDGVMWLRQELGKQTQTYQELQPKWIQAIAGIRKGDILPELRDILHENFLQNEVGEWYLPDLENEIDLEKLRTKQLLRQFAAYKELAEKPKAKIKEARVEALRAGFKQCYKEKDFVTIVTLGDKIPNNLLIEDEVLLQYYDIASSRV